VEYTGSWLWQNAFEHQRDDAPVAEQAYFRERYLSMREKAAALVGRISADMTGMTVHDVSHLDALWEMGSIVARGSVSLNPAEAFVFGGAVLLHDAAMTLAAYPRGIADLKETTVWKDNYARLTTQAHENSTSISDANMIEQLATSEALRKLHAVQAGQLPTISWGFSGGVSEYLIDDPEVRNFYGPKIGQIAQSHWWLIGRIEEELANDLGPLGGRTSNRIDVVKIACLLRVSDAMHLDRRRAPEFLRKLLNPTGISAHHWDFQARMAVPYLENDALVYSAAPAFELSVSEAWWLAFDALTVVDRELRDVDYLLQKRGTPRLQANRVKAIATPTDLARCIETIGWVPVNTNIRVSDVPKIVATLGGKRLYGNEPTAAVRELLQNAADAVDARRRLQKRPAKWGSITVSLEERSGYHWLCVEDTGVGMSSAVLTGPLIDFGNSFWRSPLASEEFPGLQALGVSAIGRYGIGFFSVFMLGSVVRVTSRRFDKASDSAQTLEFANGLGSRPILYKPDIQNAPVDGGTRVEVRLDIDPSKPGGLLGVVRFWDTEVTPLKHLIPSIAPNLSVTLLVEENNASMVVVEPEDWLALDEAHLSARLEARAVDPRDKSKARSTRLQEIKGPDGHIYGRGMIHSGTRFSGEKTGCITVGGLRASAVDLLSGVLVGREQTAARNEATWPVPPEVLAAWATEQSRLIEAASLDGGTQAQAAQIVLLCGGAIGELPVARWEGEWISISRLSEMVAGVTELAVYFSDSVTYDEDLDGVHPKDFSNHFRDSKEVMFVPDDQPPAYAREAFRKILMFQREADEPRDIGGVVRQTIRRTWASGFEESNETLAVGSVTGEDICREVVVFTRVNEEN
jgi:hypothetical protein